VNYGPLVLHGSCLQILKNFSCGEVLFAHFLGTGEVRRIPPFVLAPLYS